ncbi:DNA-binding transcriptional dual regulator OmpR [uncultured Gammaproteobacteria bacterium]
MDRQPHILVVDDNREIRDLLARFLDKSGFRTTTVPDGWGMHKTLNEARIDLIVLDLMLPGEDGLSLCRTLRASSDVPIVMLTAMGEQTDRIIGLEMGADDYVAKPFDPRELLARIKAVLRRTKGEREKPRLAADAVIRFADWTLYTARRELVDGNGMVEPLSSGEFDLLMAFVEHAQKVLNRDQLLDLARGRSAQVFDRSIDTQVMRLRKKIEEDPKNPKLIKTAWGEGYMFTPKVLVE